MRTTACWMVFHTRFGTFPHLTSRFEGEGERNASMHSLRKYQGFIIYQTWADIESFGTDKSVPYEGLINERTIYLIKTYIHIS